MHFCLLNLFLKNILIYTLALSIQLVISGSGALCQIKVTPTSSWQNTLKDKKGSISVLWYEIEPFLYKNDKGGMIGVEYDLMEGFKGFLRQKYDIDLRINWINTGSFESIMPFIEKSSEKGLFGMSFYSITEERKKKIKFSPPYMPDLNILVSNNNLPVYPTDKALIRDMARMKGFTMKQTTMEDDLLKLQKEYFPALPVYNQSDDYEVLKQISLTRNAFGYVPVSMYVTALQRGVKIKRQRVLAVRREGFAAIYTKTSDWDEAVSEYFNSAECRVLVSGLIRRYLGPEVADIILNISATDTLHGTPTDIELLTKEREIVTQRLISTALDAERNKTQRNVIFLISTGMLIIAAFAFSRYRTKSKLSKLLQVRSTLIAEQKEKLDQLNKQLNMKILQSKLNPHFLFNSLNAVQYHVGEGDKKAALQYLTHFSGFLRKVLSSGDELLIPVTEEAQLAEKYLWLEQHRFPGKFTYSIHTDEKAAAYKTPPMLIHSILQEALYKNIINAEKQDGYVNINFKTQNGYLLIRVTDNGPQISGDFALQKNNGLPEGNTDIMARRLKEINNAALSPVKVIYGRSGNENTAELIIAQPLFNS